MNGMGGNPHAATTEAAAYILRERLNGHKAEAQQSRVFAVYVHSTSIPDDVPEAVRIVEETLRGHVMAKALFHDKEVKRFEAALAKLPVVISGD